MITIEYKFNITAELTNKEDAEMYRSELSQSIERIEERIRKFFDYINQTPSLLDVKQNIKTEVTLL